jgi:hypothetical protein
MWGCFHHPAGDRNGIFDILQKGNGPTIALVVHDASVQGDLALPVRKTAQSHTLALRIGLGNTNPRFHSIQCGALLIQYGPGGLVGIQSVLPGGEHTGGSTDQPIFFEGFGLSRNGQTGRRQSRDLEKVSSFHER